MKRFLIVGCLAALLGGCGGSNDKNSSCASDAECKGDRICSDGACVDPGSDTSTGDGDRTDDDEGSDNNGFGDEGFGNNGFGDDGFGDDDGESGGDSGGFGSKSNGESCQSAGDCESGICLSSGNVCASECESDWDCGPGVNCRADSTSGPFTCR